MTQPNHTSERHLYLFALAVTPLEVGRVYDELPLHCTFMFRFWSALQADGLAAAAAPIFEAASVITLTPYEHTHLGPNQVGAHVVEKTPELMGLHMQLHDLLIALDAEFTKPQWVGEGYKPHITDRADESVAPGQPLHCPAAYLIEVIDGRRVVRSRFMLPLS